MEEEDDGAAAADGGEEEAKGSNGLYADMMKKREKLENATVRFRGSVAAKIEAKADPELAAM